MLTSQTVNSDDDSLYNGIYVTDTKTGLVTTILNVSLHNNSNHVLKLYSQFPGNRDINIYQLTSSKYDKDSYVSGSENGVWIENYNDGKEDALLQGCNQFIYFRLKNINDGTMYYNTGNTSNLSNKLSSSKSQYKSTANTKINKTVAYMYPRITDKYGLCIDSNSVGSYLNLAPGEEIIIPVVFEFYINQDEVISKTISFDILPSLYKDPITYTFRVNAKYSLNSSDKILASGRTTLLNNLTNWGLSAIKYKSVFK
jgi:hypothetical protein